MGEGEKDWVTKGQAARVTMREAEEVESGDGVRWGPRSVPSAPSLPAVSLRHTHTFHPLRRPPSRTTLASEPCRRRGWTPEPWCSSCPSPGPAPTRKAHGSGLEPLISRGASEPALGSG